MNLIEDIKRADEAASVAHDFIHGVKGVTKKQAADAIWRIHDALRPYIPLDDHPEFAQVLQALKSLERSAS